METWTIGYTRTDDLDEKYFIEVFAKGPFEAYRNGWEMAAIIEKISHDKLMLVVINAGTIEENKRRFKIKDKNIKMK